MARHARVIEREKAFADGLTELLAKQNASFKRSRQPPTGSSCPGNQLACSSLLAHVPASDDVFETQVQLLASFFREMAVHVPSEADTCDESNGIDGKLVDQFSELFERDTKLLNMLDEEKWMPDEERSKRVQLRANAMPSNVFGDSEPAHDDYINTARYIEALMRDVAQQEQGDDDALNTEKQRTGATDALQHLQASWTYAQHRVSSEAQPQRQMQAQKLQLESVRREEWMKSHHVTDLASQARFTAASSPTRTPMSLSKTAFDKERRDLPWNPVWEVIDSSENVTGCISPRQEESSAHDGLFSPKRPRERPRTTSTTERSAYSTARSGEGEIKQLDGGTETAAASASFAYANRRRLERVCTAGPSRSERKMVTHSAPPSRSTANPPFQKTQAPSSRPNQSNNMVDSSSHEFSAASRASDRLVPTRLSAGDGPECDVKDSCAEPAKSPSALETRKVDEVCSSTETKEPSRKKRGRRKAHNKSESSMRRRVMELLAVSKAVMEYSRMDESDAAAGLYPATTTFPIPARPKPQSKTRRP